MNVIINARSSVRYINPSKRVIEQGSIFSFAPYYFWAAGEPAIAHKLRLDIVQSRSVFWSHKALFCSLPYIDNLLLDKLSRQKNTTLHTH